MRKFVSLVMAAALIIATVMAMIVPKAARAAEDTVSGQFGVNDGTFTVDNVTIWSMAPAEVTTMAPHTPFHVKVDITNTNGLDKITQIDVILFYESDGTYDSGNEVGSNAAADQATLRWTPAADFVLVGPGSTTWACDNSSSVEPANLAVPNGSFEFHATIGDVATHTATGKWFAYAVATDASISPDFEGSALDMSWYGAIAAGASVTWTAAAPGAVYTQRDVSVNYIANGNYVKSARASATWNAATLTDSDTLGSNEFALKIDDQNLSEPVGSSRVTSSYESIGSDGQTDEGGDNDTSGLWLKLGSPFTKGTYMGTVYLQISNT
jgi:hypothetical protein